MTVEHEELQNPLPAIPMVRECPFSPPPEYKQLRQSKDWVKVTVMDGREVWLVSTYKETRTILGDPRFSSDRTKEGFPFINQAQKELVKSSPAMVTSDEPLHSEIRRRATYAFTAKKVEALRASVQTLVDALIDDMMEKGGPVDLVADFALVIPSTIISGILGVPAEDHTHFHELPGTSSSRALVPVARTRWP